MSLRLRREIDKLKRQILALGAEVENDVRAAVRGVETRDLEMIKSVADRENRVNAMEVDVEEECLKILALYQPVAADLRYIIAVLKINHDLERIGDLATHIAERGMFLCSLAPIGIPKELGDMAERAQTMLKRVLDAFVNLDDVVSHEVCASDKAIDEIHRGIFQKVKQEVLRAPEQFEAQLQILHIARHIERIADHATNIAEDLIYLIEGRIVRHTPEVSDRTCG